MPRDPATATDAGRPSQEAWQCLPTVFAPADLPRRRSWRWFAARLSAMSPAEVGSRAWGLVRRASCRAHDRPSPVAETRVCPPWLPAPHPGGGALATEIEDDARTILAGRYPLLGRWIEAGVAPRWVEPFRSALAPHASGTSLDPAEEIRYALELNRHGHFVTLTQAWMLGRTQQPLQRIAAHLSDWLTQCPRGTGPGWSAAIEPSMRILQWSIVWQWARPLDAWLGHDLRTRWLESIRQHVHFVRLNLSSHTSANNHLIAELTGLVVAAATWPGIADPQRVGLRALGALESELLLQHADDGVNREQAIAYQIFVFDLFLMARMAAPALGRPMSVAVDETIAHGARFVAALRDRSGALPAWGDSDDADAIRWGRGCLATRARRMVTIAAATELAPDLAPLADPAEPALTWLGQSLPATADAADRCRAALPRRFPAGGYYLLGSDFGAPREVLACIDCGPLGYPAIAAHGHADALAFTLSVGGNAVLVDRGTYTYNARPAVRRRLRGTLQHNSVTVDGRDQSEPGGPFLWTRRAAARCLHFSSTDERGEFVGTHDGYASLPDPVRHVRQVLWERATCRLQVVDRLSAVGEHQVAVAWQFDPQCRIAPQGTAFAVTVPAAALRISASVSAPAARRAPRFRWLAFHGDRESLIGWHSVRFGELQAAPTLLFGGTCSAEATITTTIDIAWLEAAR